ncbi:hypothetical protein BCR36DRAFT_343723, partial [Piromyces finnis]
MNNLSSIAIQFNENELKFISNEVKENLYINGDKVWESIFKINISEILKEDSSNILLLLNVLEKYIEKCLLVFSEDQLKQWIMEINTTICSVVNKNEIIINEILKFNNIQLNILLENKEKEKINVNYSEWIFNFLKFQENFKKSNFEWKLFKEYVKIFESLLILDKERTNLNNITESIISLITIVLSHTQ